MTTALAITSNVEAKVAELQPLDGPSQGAAVTALLDQARFGLRVAIAAQDLHRIVEWKAKAVAVQEVARQLQLGKDMQLDATEFVRRAERGLGVAIREGQAQGVVETIDEARIRAGKARHSAPGSQPLAEKPRPIDYAKPSDLSGSGAGPGIYDLTDEVSDEVFEEAIAEAREEVNLSRANVARKAKSKAKPQPKAESEPEQPQQQSAIAYRRSQKHQVNALINTNHSLIEIADVLDGIFEKNGGYQDTCNRISRTLGRITK